MLITLSSDDPFLINIIEKLAGIKHLSTSEIAIIYDRVTTHIQEPSVSQSVRDEVTQLAKTLADIENDFSTIERHLLRIDNKKEIVVDGKPRVYAPEWRKLHEEFTQLTRLSQTTANKVKSQIGDLTRNVIPSLQNPGYDPKNKKEELERYIANLSLFQEDGSNVEGRFLHLGNQVADFRNHLKLDVINQNPSESPSEVTQRVAQIDGEIEMLQEELKRIGGFFGGLCNVMKLTGVKVSTLGADGVSILSPIAAIAAFAPIVAGSLLAVAIVAALGSSIALGVIDHNTQKTAKKQALQEFETERERLTIGRKNLREISERLNLLNSTFDDILGRLSSIQQIWHMLVLDSQNLRNALEELPLSATHDNSFERKLASVKALYDALFFALDQYTLQVSDARVSSQTSA